MSSTSICERRPRAARAKIAAIAALAGCALALFAVPAAAANPPKPAANAPRITFGVQPALRTTFDSSRADFSYSATPGARMTDYIAFRNYALAPVKLDTYAGDAFNGPTGAFDVFRRNQKSTDLGAWISLARSSVTVPGRGFVIVPFRVSVPADALPGDHDAGIVAAIITQELRSNGSKVNVEERVGARVRLRVSGPLKPELTVRNLKVTYTGSLSLVGNGRALVTYDIANTGNVVLSADQRVQLHALIGGTKKAPAQPGRDEPAAAQQHPRVGAVQERSGGHQGQGDRHAGPESPGDRTGHGPGAGSQERLDVGHSVGARHPHHAATAGVRGSQVVAAPPLTQARRRRRAAAA